MITVLQIAENILLLSFMGLAYFFVDSNRSRLDSTTANILIGLSFGLTAALVTAVPVTLGDGATVDARAGPVILSAIAAGPVGAALAALFGATARGLVGGSFAFSGVAVYFVYALIGLGLRHFRVVSIEMFPSARSLSLIVFSSFCGAASMFLLIRPFERALHWLQSDLPLIFVANTMSVAYSVACISLVVIYVRRSAEVVRVNEALNMAKRAGRFGTWDFAIATGKLEWDDVSRELHGVRDSEFTGTFEDWEKTVHPDDLQQAKDNFQEAVSGEADKIFDAEYRVRLPDGRENWIKGDAIVIRDANGQATRVVGSNIDLTAIRRTESELADAQSVAIQAQKLETVGQLTGGVAHDFNNLLAVIMGNLELLMTKMQDDGFSHDDARKFIEDSLNAARRGADLTQNMLSYARKAQLNPVALDLNDVVRQTEKWISRTIESSVHIETALEEDVWLIKADIGSMQSALVNLIVNARDAVNGAGHVRIETANVVLDEAFLDYAGERPAAGHYVMLSVQDDGVGMDTVALQKLFDPFYTTKPVGQGTGLGLSTVQGYVKQSLGVIKVASEPGEGTLFRLYFPAIRDGAVAAERPQLEESGKQKGRDGTARILLVEDQADVRTVLCRMLESFGYQVTTAVSGDEAFDLCRTDNDFDLVLTDIVMPGRLQGPALARALSEQYPQLRFIFVTGYDSQSSSDDQDFMRDVIRLMKPVTQRQLLEAITESLGTRTT